MYTRVCVRTRGGTWFGHTHERGRVCRRACEHDTPCEHTCVCVCNRCGHACSIDTCLCVEYTHRRAPPPPPPYRCQRWVASERGLAHSGFACDCGRTVHPHALHVHACCPVPLTSLTRTPFDPLSFGSRSLCLVLIHVMQTTSTFSICTTFRAPLFQNYPICAM